MTCSNLKGHSWDSRQWWLLALASNYTKTYEKDAPSPLPYCQAGIWHRCRSSAGSCAPLHSHSLSSPKKKQQDIFPRATTGTTWKLKESLYCFLLVKFHASLLRFSFILIQKCVPCITLEGFTVMTYINLILFCRWQY